MDTLWDLCQLTYKIMLSYADIMYNDFFYILSYRIDWLVANSCWHQIN